jgi:hypothetical protein
MVMSRHAQLVFERQRALLRRLGEAITPATVRFHAVTLAAGMWIAALAMVSTAGAFDRHGTLKGIDFLQFHTASRLVAEGRARELYDWSIFARELQHAVPGTGDALFLSVYPPQLALALAPLGRLEYLTALACWTTLSVLLYAGCAYVLMRASPVFHSHATLWWLVAAAFAPFQQLVLHGQIGTLVLVCLTCAWVALRHGSAWWCGAALGSLVFKPPFAIAAALAALVSRDYRVAAGAGCAAIVQGAVTAAWLGAEVIRSYLAKVPVLLQSGDLLEPKPWQMHNLKGFWRLLLGAGSPAMVVTVVVSVAVVCVAYATWRRTTAPDVRMSSLVLATVLVNPHLYVYDLVVLAVPLTLMAAWAIRNRPRAETPVVVLLVHALCWLPLLGPLAAVTHVQITVPCMCALLWLVYRVAKGSTAYRVAEGATLPVVRTASA